MTSPEKPTSKPDVAELPHRMTVDDATGLTLRGDMEGEPFVFFPDDGAEDRAE